MDVTSDQPLSLLSWMASLSDATRLRLLHLLDQCDLRVVDLCDVLQMPQSTVSRHLKVLSDQGWTRSRREGTTNQYFLADEDLSAPAKQLWELTKLQTGRWATLIQDGLRLERRLRAREIDSKDFFAGAAEHWQNTRESLYGKRFSDAAVLSLLPGDWTVADLGCGTGELIESLAGQVSQVIGIDQSPEMLEAARVRTASFDNVDVREGDLSGLPIDDGSCDAAMMVLVLTYVDDFLEPLREACRILKSGGKLVIVDLLHHDRDDFRRQMGQSRMGFELPEIEAMMQQAGFEETSSQPLPPETDVTGPALLLATGMKF